VLPSLDFILENPKFEPELRNAIQEHLMVLLDRNNGTKPPDIINMGIVSSTNNNSENHVMEQILSSTTPAPSSSLSSTVNSAISNALSYSNSNTITLRASPPPAPHIGSTPVSVITSNTVSSTTSINPPAIPQSNTINSTTFSLGSDRIKIEQPDVDFSDDDDDYAEGSQADLLVPKGM
jgi:phage baseplate assembly protein gpV